MAPCTRNDLREYEEVQEDQLVDRRQGLGVQTGGQLPTPALSRVTAEGEVKAISKEPVKEEGGPEREHLSRSREGVEPRQGLRGCTPNGNRSGSLDPGGSPGIKGRSRAKRGFPLRRSRSLDVDLPRRWSVSPDHGGYSLEKGGRESQDSEDLELTLSDTDGEGDVTLTQEGEEEGDEEDEEVDQGGKETVVVGQLSGGAMYRVPVRVQGRGVRAVVDTAAQVTLISEELYKSLVEPPKIIKEVVMNTAGKGLQMNGFIAGPFRVELGEQTFSINIYVAPIGDEMLLGLDFLGTHGISLDLKKGELTLHGEVVPMRWEAVTLGPKVTCVRAGEAVRVPPNSVVRMKGQLEERLGRDYIIEAQAKGDLLIPRTLRGVEQDPILCLINLSDRHIRVERGHILAHAQEVHNEVGGTPEVHRVGVSDQKDSGTGPE